MLRRVVKTLKCLSLAVEIKFFEILNMLVVLISIVVVSEAINLRPGVGR